MGFTLIGLWKLIRMKLLTAAVLAVLAVSAFAEIITVEPEWKEIDWASVVPVTDMPGFWDGREIRPAFYPNDQTRSGRIVGGAIVTPGAHPYQAGLLMAFSGGTGLCGGSLISTTRVLTAAHCPIGSSSTQVILGAHTLTANEATQQRRTVPSANYRNHPSYNPGNLNNDISVLILPTAVGFTARIQPSALASGTATFAGELATVSGIFVMSVN